MYKPTMKEVVLAVSDDYNIPEVINGLSSDIIESLLDAISSITLENNTKNIKLNTTSLNKELEQSYKLQKLKKNYEDKINNSNELSKQLKEQLDQQSQSYKDQLESFKKERTESMNMLHTSIQQQLKDKIESKTDMITHLKEQIATQKNEISNTTNLYKTLIDNSSCMYELDNKLQLLNTSLEPVVKYHSGTSEEKRVCGEQTVFNLLRDDPRYETAELIDASGDILFKWKNLKCLIEVKNKKILTKEDIHKFIKDVKESCQSDKAINCAVFVSLQTSVFPERSRELIQFDLINNIPVIYTYLSEVDRLHYSMICLDNIVKTTRNDTDKMKQLLSFYQGYYHTVQHMYDYFNKLIKSRQLEIRSMQKEMNTLAMIEESLSQNVNNFSDISNDSVNDNVNDSINDNVNDNVNDSINDNVNNFSDISNNDNGNISDISNNDNGNISDISNNDNGNNMTSDDVLSPIKNKDGFVDEEETEVLDLTTRDSIERSKNKIMEYYINTSLNYYTKIINISDITLHFNITPNILLKKLSGFKSLIANAKYIYFLQRIPINTINKLKLYKTVHGSYPKRPLLIKKYISHRTLTDLGHVLKNKKIMEYIYGFAETHCTKSADVESVDVESDETHCTKSADAESVDVESDETKSKSN
jgi:hypothetical protein